MNAPNPETVHEKLRALWLSSQSGSPLSISLSEIMADLKAIPYVVSVDPDLAFDREQEKHGTPLDLSAPEYAPGCEPPPGDGPVTSPFTSDRNPLEFGHLNPEPLFPEPEPVPPSPRAEPTLENIENTIRFADRLVQGIYTDADGPRPFMEKQSLLAALYTAHALQRIAAALEKPLRASRTRRRIAEALVKGFAEWVVKDPGESKPK